MSVIAMARRCRSCSRQHQPHRLEIQTRFVDVCDDCMAAHRKAIEAIHQGVRPEVCGRCGADFREVSNLRVFLHELDGLKAWLCPSCSEKHVKAHPERYKGTPYGSKIGLG